MNYYFEDFTEYNYQYLLQKYIKDQECIFFSDALKEERRIILMRHDIDFSVHRAYKLAKIENSMGIKSTYFLHMNSCFYNLFEKDIYNLVREILKLGHQVGLHYDCDFRNNALINQSEFEKELKKNRKILSNLFEEEILSFSFHNPTEDILKKFNELKYDGMINAYGKEIVTRFKYCSDSNGYWRYQRLEEFLEQNIDEKIQILTHPAWWTEEVMSPRERIQRVIKGRTLRTQEQYDNILKLSNRKNIGI